MKNTSLTFLALNPEMPTVDSLLVSFLENFCAYSSTCILHVHKAHGEAFRKPVSPVPCSFYLTVCLKCFSIAAHTELPLILVAA